MDRVAQVSQRGERPGHLGGGDRFVADVERVEESLVDESTDGILGAAVEVVEVFAENLEGEVEGVGDVIEADVQAVDQGFCILASFTQAGLLVVEEFAADAVFVVHVQELALLLLDFVQNASAAVDLPLSGCGALAEVFGERPAYRLAFGLGERNARVMVLDGHLNYVDGLVALRAFTALVALADEVFVDAAVAVVAGVDQAAAASATADGALEVVLVLTVALARVSVRGEDGLDLVEELLADERLVPARVVLAPVGDDPGVVGAGEHVVDAGETQRSWGAATVASCAQAAGFQQQHHVGDAVEASSVGLERPADDWGALGVDGNGANLAALGQLLADVQVAEADASECAAALGLLGGALEDLVGEVATVVLGEGRQHTVHQPARRGLIDVLRGADQPGARQLDIEQHVGVVAAVTREPIDLPADDVVDVALLYDASEHSVQFGALVGLGGLGALYVLIDHHGVVVAGLLRAALALRGDRQAVLVVVGFQLPA